MMMKYAKEVLMQVNDLDCIFWACSSCGIWQKGVLIKGLLVFVKRQFQLVRTNDKLSPIPILWWVNLLSSFIHPEPVKICETFIWKFAIFMIPLMSAIKDLSQKYLQDIFPRNLLIFSASEDRLLGNISQF